MSDPDDDTPLYWWELRTADDTLLAWDGWHHTATQALSAGLHDAPAHIPTGDTTIFLEVARHTTSTETSDRHLSICRATHHHPHHRPLPALRAAIHTGDTKALHTALTARHQT